MIGVSRFPPPSGGWPLVLLGICAAAIGGCDGCVPPSGGPDTGCIAADGAELTVGETAPAGDGCNTCICNSSVELVCGTRNCADAGPAQADAGAGEDAGPGDDAGPEDAGVIDEGPCPDEDGDGYHACVDPDYPERRPEVDCDDRRFHVQPNGYEFPDTTEDDNCDGQNDDWSNCDCGLASLAESLAGAMDVCSDFVSGQQKTGAVGQLDVADAYRGVIDGRLRVRIDDPAAPPVIIGNDCELVMSTGDAVGTDLDVEASNCFFSDPDPAGDTNYDTICDLASLTMVLNAPSNARGFAFDFMFLSHEWPEFLCLEFNDTFYASVETDAVNGGAPTNAAFDTQGRAITVNVGFFENPTPDGAGWTVPLDGTPFAMSTSDECTYDPNPGCTLPSYCDDPALDARRGSGSGWLTTTVPVVPGEQGVRMKLTIHDEGDQQLDSLVIVDGFRWLPHEVVLGTEKGR